MTPEEQAAQIVKMSQQRPFTSLDWEEKIATALRTAREEELSLLRKWFWWWVNDGRTHESNPYWEQEGDALYDVTRQLLRARARESEG